MSKALIALSQFIFFLWPVFALIVLVYSFEGHWTLKALVQRIKRNLLITMLALLPFWVAALFAARSTPPLLIPEPANTMVFLGLTALLVLIAMLPRIIDRAAARFVLRRASDLEALKQMDPKHFEELVAEIYRAQGHRVKHAGKSGDHGVDVEVRTRSGALWVVQCKRYRTTVGEGIVRELYGTMISEKAQLGVLVTTAEMTLPAKQWAKGKPIDLIDGSRLLDMISEARQRRQNSPFDRLAALLDRLFVRRPSVLGRRWQPVTGYGEAITSSAPDCPIHGAQMNPRPQRSGDRPGRALYRCPNYPECRVTLEGR